MSVTACDSCSRELPTPPDPYGTVSLVLCDRCNGGKPIAGGWSLPPQVGQFERKAIYAAHDSWAREVLRAR